MWNNVTVDLSFRRIQSAFFRDRVDSIITQKHNPVNVQLGPDPKKNKTSVRRFIPVSCRSDDNNMGGVGARRYAINCNSCLSAHHLENFRVVAVIFQHDVQGSAFTDVKKSVL